MSLEKLADTLLEKLKGISKAETIIGEPINANGTTVIPVSKVSLGFGMGQRNGKADMEGSGGGVSLEPVAFLVISDKEVKLLPVNQETSTMNKVVELIPEVISSFKKSDSDT